MVHWRQWINHFTLVMLLVVLTQYIHHLRSKVLVKLINNARLPMNGMIGRLFISSMLLCRSFFAVLLDLITDQTKQFITYNL